jgi:hypothetical protein
LPFTVPQCHLRVGCRGGSPALAGVGSGTGQRPVPGDGGSPSRWGSRGEPHCQPQVSPVGDTCVGWLNTVPRGDYGGRGGVKKNYTTQKAPGV